MMEYDEERILQRTEYQRAVVLGTEKRWFVRIPEDIQLEWMRWAVDTGSSKAVTTVIQEIESLETACDFQPEGTFSHVLAFGRDFAMVSCDSGDFRRGSGGITPEHAYGITTRLRKLKRAWKMEIRIRRFA